MKRISAALISLVMLFSAAACSADKTEPNAVYSGDKVRVLMTVKDYGDITFELYPDAAPVAVEKFCEKVNSGFYDGKNFHRVVADFMIQGGSASGTGASNPDADIFKAEVTPEMRHYYGALCMAATSTGDISDSFYIVNSKDTEAFAELETNVSALRDTLQYYKDSLEDIDVNEEEYVAAYGEDAVAYGRAECGNQITYYTNLIDYIENATDEVKEKYAKEGGSPFLDGGYTVFGYAVDGFDVIDKISEIEVEAQSGEGSEISKPVNEILIEKVVIKENF